MKKLILPVIAILSIGSASAQFNIGVSVGYGFASPSEVLGTTSAATTDENIYGTYGTGIHLNLNPGYTFGEHVGIELGLNGFLGSKTTITDATSPFGTYTADRYSNQFRVSPMLVLNSGGEKLNLYTKAGFILPVTGKIFTERNDNNSQGNGMTTVIKAETTGKIGLGFTGALGVNYGLSEKLSLFGEVAYNSINIKSKATTVTQYDVNGADQLGNLKTYQKETNYEDKIDGSSNTGSNPNFDQNKAFDALRETANFSNVAIQIGVKFSL